MLHRLFSKMGDNIITCGGQHQYCVAIASVLWGITEVHVGDSFSAV